MLLRLVIAAVALLQAAAIEIHGLGMRGRSSGHSFASHQTMLALRAMGGQGSLGLRVYTSLKAEARMETEALHLNQNLLGIIKKLQDSGDQINKLVVLPNEPQVTELVSMLDALESTTAAPTPNATNHKHLRHHAAAATTTAAAPASSKVGSALSANVTKALVQQRDSLKSLFTHLKANIAKFNKEQANSKGDHDKVMKQLEKRFEQDSEKLKNPKLSAFEHERLTNLTRAENGEIVYWRKGRQLQQTMFHANLKITHGLMSRSKAVMDAYEQAITTGHLDKKTTEELKSAMASLPKAFIVVKRVIKREGMSLKRHIMARAHLGLPP